MINGYIFAPGRYLQQNLKKGFDALEKNLDENSA